MLPQKIMCKFKKILSDNTLFTMEFKLFSHFRYQRVTYQLISGDFTLFMTTYIVVIIAEGTLSKSKLAHNYQWFVTYSMKYIKLTINNYMYNNK